MEKRVIQSRKKVNLEKEDRIFSDKFELVSWVLSIIKWKELGYSVNFYTDSATLKKMKEFKINDLYDNVNISLLDNPWNTEDIDFKPFWAMSKIIAYKHEIELGENPIICDTDIIPMDSNIDRTWNNSDTIVWSNKEQLIHTGVYPKLSALSLPEGYTIPSWFSGKQSPLNTGVLFFRNTKYANEYINNIMAWVKNNKNEKNNTACVTMCNAEQRMLGEYLHYRDLGYYTIQGINESIFSKLAIHTHGYKDYWKKMLKYDPSVSLNLTLNFLLMLRKSNEEYFNILINHELFKEEKDYFERNGYKCEIIKELQQYKDIF